MSPFSRRAARSGLVAAFVLASSLLFTPAHAEEAGAPTLGSTSSGKAMNPDLSLDGLFALSQFNRDQPVTFDGGHDPHQSGFNIQQVELSLGSNIDPYFRGDANLVLTPEGIEIEEAYATTLGLPANLQLKAGQFLTAFGRFNPTHPHTWDFANKPLVEGRFFGGDGLRNPGAQVSWLAPLPWYSEVIASAQNSTGETANSFNSDGTIRSLSDAVLLARLNNFFTAGELFSVNVGASYLTGQNRDAGQAPINGTTRTQIVGGDLFVKFREPSQLSFITLQTEVMKRYYAIRAFDPASGQVGSARPSDWGGYAQVDCRLPEGWERWHVGARYDWVSDKGGVPVITSSVTTQGVQTDLDTSRCWRLSPVVTFYPSEFSKVRLQYDYDRPANFTTAQQVATLQLEFMMGAHGAHKF